MLILAPYQYAHKARSRLYKKLAHLPAMHSRQIHFILILIYYTLLIELYQDCIISIGYMPSFIL